MQGQARAGLCRAVVEIYSAREGEAAWRGDEKARRLGVMRSVVAPGMVVAPQPRLAQPHSLVRLELLTNPRGMDHKRAHLQAEERPLRLVGGEW